MQVFQRIFQRNDMPFARMVDSIDKAGHGCGFSASGRSGYKNHAFCQISNTHDILGNRKLGGIRQLESDNTYDCCQRTTLFVSIDTKTWQTWNRKGKVIVTGIVQSWDITVIRHLINCFENFTGLFRHQTVTIGGKTSIGFYRKWTSCNNKNIWSVQICCLREKFQSLFFIHECLLYKQTDWCPESRKPWCLFSIVIFVSENPRISPGIKPSGRQWAAECQRVIRRKAMSAFPRQK